MNDQLLSRTIICITVLSIVALLVGAALMFRGYQGGEIAMTIASGGLSGLVGFIGGKMAGKPIADDTITLAPVPPPLPPTPKP